MLDSSSHSSPQGEYDDYTVTAALPENFFKKMVLNDVGEEFEVIEILEEGVENHDVFIYCTKEYIRRFYGELGTDYVTAIYAFPRRKIYDESDIGKPMYQGVEIENNDHSKFWLYFEIPKKKHV